jgi:hypothetical protein
MRERHAMLAFQLLLGTLGWLQGKLRRLALN